METSLIIKLPEGLRQRAEDVAVLRGETLSDFIREALEDFIIEALEEAEDERAVREIEAQIARGEEPLYSHEEVWAEIDELEAKGELPA